MSLVALLSWSTHVSLCHVCVCQVGFVRRTLYGDMWAFGNYDGTVRPSSTFAFVSPLLCSVAALLSLLSRSCSRSVIVGCVLPPESCSCRTPATTLHTQTSHWSFTPTVPTCATRPHCRRALAPRAPSARNVTC